MAYQPALLEVRDRLIHELVVPATHPAPKYASPSDWEPLRPLIKKLYIDEDIPLKEVISIMAREQGHRGSVKMYKSRINKWGLVKNRKERDMWAIIRKNTQRSAAGKASRFRVHGQAISIEDVQHYFKRRGITSPSSEVASVEVSTPSEISCWTPSPSPSPTSYPGEGLHVHNEISDRSFHSLFSSSRIGPPPPYELFTLMTTDKLRRSFSPSQKVELAGIPRLPSPPQYLVMPERLFLSIMTFYRGSIDNGHFMMDNAGYLVATYPNHHRNDRKLLYEFISSCFTGARLISTNSFVECRRVLSKASAIVEQTVLGQHPRALDCLLQTFLELQRRGCIEVVSLLRNHISQIAAKYIPGNYPWGQILYLIGNTKESDLEPVMIQAWRCICDILREEFGPLRGDTLNTYTRFILCAYHPQEAERLFLNLLESDHHDSSLCERNALEYQKHYGLILFNRRKYREALSVYENLIVQYQDQTSLRLHEIDALEIIAWCRRALGRRCEAEKSLRDAIELCSETNGRHHPDNMVLMSTLEQWLRSWNRNREADSLRLEMTKLIEPDDIDDFLG